MTDATSLGRRIMIIGPSGSGKSTLARSIGHRLGIPAIHLDALFWQPGWVMPDESEFRARIADAAAGDVWVIDGNYSRHMDLRLSRAHSVIYLDLPRRIYFPRTVWRMIRNYGRERGDVGPGCPERFDYAFFRDWVWPYPTKARPKQLALMANLPDGVRGITLRSPSEVGRFIEDLPGALAL